MISIKLYSPYQNPYYQYQQAAQSGMGNNQFKYDQLQYYTTVDYQYYGKCPIYTSNKFPQCFIIKVVHALSQKNYSNNFKLYARLQNMQNLYLMGMYGYRVGKSYHCPTISSKSSTKIGISQCDEQISQSSSMSEQYKLSSCENYVISHFITLYWEYLAFSLRDILNQRKKTYMNFSEQQIWHILKACSHGYSAFQGNCTSFQFRPSNMMVNQDGRVRLNWMQIQSKNTHVVLYKKLNKYYNPDWQSNSSESEVMEGSLNLYSEEYLSPEELVLLQQKQLTNKINYEKTNIFSLGMTILECITFLDPIKNFYNPSALYVDYNRIEGALRSQGILQRYSMELLMLLRGMINWDPSKRQNFDLIKQNYHYYMKSDYSIRVAKKGGYSTKIMMKQEMKESQKISITQLKKSEIHNNFQHPREFKRI